MLTAILTKKIYTYIWCKDTKNCASKSAEIIFEFDKNTHTGFNFAECKYIGVNKIYNLDDFEFLRDLANEILKLSEEAK